MNTSSTSWYDVDKEGLAKLLERRGRAYVILELLQNAWDEVTFNLGHLSRAWFQQDISVEQDALILHELAHDRVSDHLDHAFADEIARLGALLARAYRSAGRAAVAV